MASWQESQNVLLVHSQTLCGSEKEKGEDDKKKMIQMLEHPEARPRQHKTVPCHHKGDKT